MTLQSQPMRLAKQFNEKERDYAQNESAYYGYKNYRKHSRATDSQKLKSEDGNVEQRSPNVHHAQHNFEYNPTFTGEVPMENMRQEDAMEK